MHDVMYLEVCKGLTKRLTVMNIREDTFKTALSHTQHLTKKQCSFLTLLVSTSYMKLITCAPIPIRPTLRDSIAYL